MKKKKNNAFTLAEVLIVLVVLGVISALTIPNLLGTANEKQIITGFKKGFATINNGLSMMAAAEGYTPCSAYYDPAPEWSSKLLIDHLSKYIKMTYRNKFGFITPDGIAYFLIPIGGMSCGLAGNAEDMGNTAWILVIDANGIGKGPNKINRTAIKGQIKDQFLVYMFDDGVVTGNTAAGAIFAGNFVTGTSDTTEYKDGIRIIGYTDAELTSEHFYNPEFK